MFINYCDSFKFQKSLVGITKTPLEASIKVLSQFKIVNNLSIWCIHPFKPYLNRLERVTSNFFTVLKYYLLPSYSFTLKNKK